MKKRPQYNGYFLSLEGIEGSGKTTSIEFIVNYFKENNIDFIQTREPGGTILSEKIRSLLLEKTKEPVDSTTELLMMFASRSQLLNQLIIPNLSRGVTVLCDRFTDASYAYQGGGRGLSVEKIQNLEYLLEPSIRPDKTIILDVPVEVGLNRAGKRAELDRFESEQQSFFQRVRQTYLKIAQQQPERCQVIDGTKSMKEVQADIRLILDNIFK